MLTNQALLTLQSHCTILLSHNSPFRLPSHLAPFLHPISPLSSTEKRKLFTSVYLRSASAGNSDTLEWLLSIPPDPQLTSQQNAAAARRFSLTAAQLNNMMDGLAFGSPPLGAEEVKKQSELSDQAPRKWVDLEAIDEEGNTALGLCVALGHAEAVRVLVEGGVRVTQPDQGEFLGAVSALPSLRSR